MEATSDVRLDLELEYLQEGPGPGFRRRRLGPRNPEVVELRQPVLLKTTKLLDECSSIETEDFREKFNHLFLEAVFFAAARSSRRRFHQFDVHRHYLEPNNLKQVHQTTIGRFPRSESMELLELKY